MAPEPSHRPLAARLEGLNLYLVGMMGAGKSAVGRPLAEALGYRFLDADTTIEQVAEHRSRRSSPPRGRRDSGGWKPPCSIGSPAGIPWWWPPAAGW